MRYLTLITALFVLFAFVGCSSAPVENEVDTDMTTETEEELSPAMAALLEQAGNRAGTENDPLNTAGFEYLLRSLPRGEDDTFVFEAEDMITSAIVVDAVVLLEDGTEINSRKAHLEYPLERYPWSCARFDEDNNLIWTSRVMPRYGADNMVIGLEFMPQNNPIQVIVYRRDFNFNLGGFGSPFVGRIMYYVERAAYDWFVTTLRNNGMNLPGETEAMEESHAVTPTEEPPTPEPIVEETPIEDTFFYRQFGEYAGEPEEGHEGLHSSAYAFEFMNSDGLLSGYSQDEMIDGQLVRMETVLEIDNRGLVVVYFRFWFSPTESRAMRDGSQTIPMNRLRELTNQARAWLAAE